MTVSYKLLKALCLPSWSSVGFIVADDIRVEIGGHGLDGTVGGGSEGVGEQKTDERDRWGWVVRNSLVVWMSSLRVKDVLSFQMRVLVDCC